MGRPLTPTPYSLTPRPSISQPNSLSAPISNSMSLTAPSLSFPSCAKASPPTPGLFPNSAEGRPRFGLSLVLLVDCLSILSAPGNASVIEIQYVGPDMQLLLKSVFYSLIFYVLCFVALWRLTWAQLIWSCSIWRSLRHSMIIQAE
jgi:hypothetical protein